MGGMVAKNTRVLAPISPEITKRGLQFQGQKKSREWVKGFEMRLWDLNAPCFCSGNNSTVLLKPVRQSSLGSEVVDQCPGAS